MINDRKLAFDTISRVLAITRLDIEHHQGVNDFSLNIHGENYFKDIFNIVYDSNFENVNQGSFNNAEYIDLVDIESKKVIQVTTTRSKKKIINSLKALSIEKYKNYEISIYYLLDKAKPNKGTIAEVKSKHPDIKLKEILFDSNDLISDISNLEEGILIDLCNRYFSNKESKYTEKIVLDLVFNKLLAEKNNHQPNYDDDFGSLETTRKIQLNNINDRIAGEINRSLDYTCILDTIDNGDLTTRLKDLVIFEIYKSILVEQLKSKINKSSSKNLDVSELQCLAVEHRLDFNKLINTLQRRIDSLIIVKDFNSMDISWVLVSYFFEICDVGVKE